MKEVKENLWTYMDGTDEDYAICITTNGFVKKNGEAVMGRGCAKEATELFPGVQKILGTHIKKCGNVPGILLHAPQIRLISFPVKHNWWEKADIKLIKKSARWLNLEALGNPGIVYLLPRPGCGNGQLDWKEVKKVIKFLPDNVFVISK